MNYKQEIAKTQKEKLAGFCYDLAKLVFGATVIGGLTPYMLGTVELVNWVVVISGALSSFFFAWLGNKFLKV